MTGDPRSQFLTLGEHRFHLLEWGRDEDVDVVDGGGIRPRGLILHGFAGHAWQAEPTASLLAQDRRVLALDQRGHGDSDWADTYGAKPMVADVLALLDALEIERVSLIGHSMGGMVATAVAALHPERVSAVVLGDIGPEVASAGTERIQRQVREQDVFATVDEAYALLLSHDPYADHAALRSRVEHNLRALPDGTLTWKYDKALRDGTARYDNFGRDEQWAFWTAINVPVLILRGEHSDVLSEEVAARMLAANPCGELRMLGGSGHSIATDVPTLVKYAITEFLRR